ncbi:MAG: hypothetical protein LBV28_02660 [Puniceicoccales bacterium]|jgi:hypothetical protein|nr:hypothetical protein [Puniceicoccales bacterium]
MGLTSFEIAKEECEKRIYTLKRYLENLTFGTDLLREGQYLTVVGTACGHFLSGATGWRQGYVIPKEKNKDYDFLAIVSPQNKYYISPILLAEREYKQIKGVIVDFYEKIKFSQLPPSEPDKFLDLDEYFYQQDKEPLILFDPLEPQELQDWLSDAQAGAAIIGVPLDDASLPEVEDVEKNLKLIEAEILRHKGSFKEFQEEPYLKALSALYGQCLKAGTNFELAVTWSETDEGIEGMPVLHSPDKCHWISPYASVWRELTSKRKTCKLRTLYHRIINNRLAAPETEMPEEIK